MERIEHLTAHLNEIRWEAVDPQKRHWKYPPVTSKLNKSDIPIWWEPKRVVGHQYTFEFYQMERHVADNILAYNDGDDGYKYAKFDSKEDLLEWVEYAKLVETANEMWDWMETIEFGFLYDGKIYV